MDHAEAALARDPHIQQRLAGHAGTAAEATVLLYSAHEPLAVLEALKPGNAGREEAVHVEVNHGRWVVECPSCRSAQLASIEDPRYLCHECLNMAIALQWRRVIWPKNYQAISDLLAVRPLENRNWKPGEKLADLKRENEEAGL